MQVLNLKLIFGENESNIENRILEISIDDKFPLQFSVINADYKITSFDQNSTAKLQLKSFQSRDTEPVYTYGSSTFKYVVDLYFKFPLNTFATNNKTVDLTFDEYNKVANNINIEFVSQSQFKEKIEENEQNDKIIRIVLIIIVFIFVLSHFSLSITYNSCVRKCLRDGIIYQDGWKITHYEVYGPLKFVRAYRFADAKDGDAKDYLYYRRDKYSPQEIYNIVTGKEITSYQIKTYKERVKTEISQKYMRYSLVIDALDHGMPDKMEYRVLWLRQKIYNLEMLIARGPEQSVQTWHGPYGWSYSSSPEDISAFNGLNADVAFYTTELYNLQSQCSDDERNAWYWCC